MLLWNYSQGIFFKNPFHWSIINISLNAHILCIQFTNLDKCVDSCNHHYSQYRKHFCRCWGSSILTNSSGRGGERPTPVGRTWTVLKGVRGVLLREQWRWFHLPEEEGVVMECRGKEYAKNYRFPCKGLKRRLSPFFFYFTLSYI